MSIEFPDFLEAMSESVGHKGQFSRACVAQVGAGGVIVVCLVEAQLISDQVPSGCHGNVSDSGFETLLIRFRSIGNIERGLRMLECDMAVIVTMPNLRDTGEILVVEVDLGVGRASIIQASYHSCFPSIQGLLGTIRIVSLNLVQRGRDGSSTS